MFIDIEGIDGSGTTTHSKLLVDYLNTRGIKTFLTSEPSQNSIGQFLRRALRDCTLDPHTDALLFAADRTEHTLKEIVPKLNEGYVVVAQRYLLSSVCYQSARSDVDPEWIFVINKKAIKPDFTIILDVDPRVSLARIANREIREKFETIEFLTMVRSNYKKYVNGKDVILVNASGSIEQTFNNLIKIIKGVCL